MHYYVYFPIALILLSIPSFPMAQDSDLMPIRSMPEEDVMLIESGETHEPIRLTPDKSEIIRLDQRAGTVIIGNPAHLSIQAENAETLVLVPGEPGATHFYVLDENAQMIMARHVIVASPKQKYIRIRNTCGDTENCRSTKVYYCPDMCHEIAPSELDTDANASEREAATSGNPQNSAAASQPDSNREFREE